MSALREPEQVDQRLLGNALSEGKSCWMAGKVSHAITFVALEFYASVLLRCRILSQQNSIVLTSATFQLPRRHKLLCFAVPASVIIDSNSFNAPPDGQ